MEPIQNGLICWLDARDGQPGETILRDRTGNEHNLVLSNFKEGYGFTGESIKIKGYKSQTGENSLCMNKRFIKPCKSFCLHVKKNTTTLPFYLFDGRVNGGLGTGYNHAYGGIVAAAYNPNKSRKNGIIRCGNSALLDNGEEAIFYFELVNAEEFTMSIMCMNTKSEQLDGEFYTLYAYDRELTDEEIYHNYIYDKQFDNKCRYVKDTSLPRLVEKLSDSKNIKIKNNKHGDRVSTVIDKITEKTDNITNATKQDLVNDTHNYKVGTGKNADVSISVEDGFSNINIKGKTLQNLCGDLKFKGSTWVENSDSFRLDLPSGNGQPSIAYALDYPLKPNTKYTIICTIKEYTIGYPHVCFMSKDNKFLASTSEFVLNKAGAHIFLLTTKTDVTAELLRFLPRNNVDNTYSIGKNIMILEGDYRNTPLADIPYIKGIQSIGNSKKNIFDGKIELGTINVNSGNNQDNSNELRSRNYIKLNSNKITINRNKGVGSFAIRFYDKNKKYIGSGVGMSPGSLSVTQTAPPNAKYCRFKDMTTDLYTVYEIEEHYEGCSIEAKSCTKNLFKGYDKTYTVTASTPILVKQELQNLIGITIPQDGLTFKADLIGIDHKEIPNSNMHYGLDIQFIFSDGTTAWSGFTRGTGFNIEGDGIIKKRAIYHMGGYVGKTIIGFQTAQIFTRNSTGTFTMKNIEILKGKDTSEGYSPYQESSVNYILKEPLRSLPNGVADEIIENKLIRRIRKVTFDGSENWRLGGWTNADRVELYGNNISLNNKLKTTYPNLICDTLQVKNYSSAINDSYKHCIICGQYISIFLSVDVIGGKDIKFATDWLAKNPITAYYELAEPIITELDNESLRIYKDGHVTFDTLIAPTSTHEVLLNKSAQIESTVKEIQSIDKKVDNLESNYNDVLLETSRDLYLLDFNYNLLKESEVE